MGHASILSLARKETGTVRQRSKLAGRDAGTGCLHIDHLGQEACRVASELVLGAKRHIIARVG